MKSTNWTNKYGETRPIKDLTDSHLINIYRMIDRDKERYRLGAIKVLSSIKMLWKDKKTAKRSDQHLELLKSMTDTEIVIAVKPCYKNIIKELKKRKLF